jgi:hypothetical protein
MGEIDHSVGIDQTSFPSIWLANVFIVLEVRGATLKLRHFLCGQEPFD